MEDHGMPSIKGQFLIAMPGMMDPNFIMTVTCICEHNPKGAMGIIINRPHPTLLTKDIFEELKIEPISANESEPIYVGGPVHIGEVFILHGPPFGWQGCLKITPTLALSNTRDLIEAIASGRGPSSFMIALGCAGWGASQLESEIKQNTWLNCAISEKIIFEISSNIRWHETVKMMGIDPMVLSKTAGHA
jgi:putative transcriptional regulator